MASTVNSVPSSNGAGGNAANSPIPPNTSGTRAPGRQNTGMKRTEPGRRQSGSPVDGGHRRNNPHQKTWTQNNMSINQKASGHYSHPNGGAPGKRSTHSPKPVTNKESNTPDLHAHDRLIFILTAAIGYNTTITTKGGEKISGIFSGAVLESNGTSFMLKMARRSLSEAELMRTNGANHDVTPYMGQSPDHQMVFDAQDVADLDIPGLSATGMGAKENNVSASNFRTDSDISGNQPGRERQLQRWEPGADNVVEWSLEGSGSGTWDQFETNARLFGATSSYDENLYTTRIDRSDPSYKRKEAEAARIAREIESSDTENTHLREERGLAQPNEDIDEEEKYSGVRRDDPNFPPLLSGQPNKYTPPARRPPTSQPTVPGAPVDPAIISAQIARSDGQPKRLSQPKPSVPASSKNVEELQQDMLVEAPKAVLSDKAAVDTETKPSLTQPAQMADTSPKRAGGVENAASNVETEVLDHFRRFANDEKLKHQERRRNQASYDRTIKLNELMKFSKNFKLRTPVPKDLVPILAKDPGKQEAIVERAKRQHEDKSVGPPEKPSAAPSIEPKPVPRSTGAARYDGGGAPASGPDKHSYSRGRPPIGPQGSRQTAHPGRAGSGLLSHRLADIQQGRRVAGIAPAPPPLPIQDPRIPPSVPSGNEHTAASSSHKPAQTPTSAISTRFNVRALEFRPNPAASTFTPVGPSVVPSSPGSNARTDSNPRAVTPSAFFGSKTLCQASERPSINDHFNPIKRMKKDVTEQSSKDYAFNRGIPPAYRTAPTWEVSPVNEEKTYADMVKAPTGGAPAVSPQTRSASNPQLPHQHQLPFHLQHGNHNAPPSTGPPQTHLIPPQHQHAAPPPFDDHHRMQMSASSSQMYPSPRLQHSPMAYQQSMGPHAQLAMGQAVPPYYFGQGPQPSHVRHYPSGPQFSNPQNGMGAPMMSHQASSGPYMGGPQGMGTPYNNPPMQMYSPNGGHAYPYPVQPPLQSHSGYPSPSRGAPMMMHQGSQQGQPPQPVMVMNAGQHGQPYYAPQHPNHMPPRPGHNQQQHPHFSSSPHQTHHYPHNQYRNQNNYNQAPHIPPPPTQPQPPQQVPPSGSHPPDAAEELK